MATNCISGAILGPVAAGVGGIVRDASETGGVTVDLDGGQLAGEPQESIGPIFTGRSGIFEQADGMRPEAGQKKTLPGRV